MKSKVIKSIPLEDVAKVKQHEEEIIFEKFNMYKNIFARHNRRSLSINNCYKLQSDDYLDEYIINDNVVATIHTRRNDANIVDLLITYFENNIDYEQDYIFKK